MLCRKEVKRQAIESFLKTLDKNERQVSNDAENQLFQAMKAALQALSKAFEVINEKNISNHEEDMDCLSRLSSYQALAKTKILG